MQSTVGMFLPLGLAAVLGVLAAVFLGMALRYRRRLHRIDPEGREMYLSYQEPDLLSAAGFRIEHLPMSELLQPQAFWLVDSTIAEIEYDIVPAQRAWLRIAPAGRLCCAQAYADITFDSSAQYQVGNVTVSQRQVTGGFCELRWQKGNYAYMLYAPAAQMSMLGGIAPLFVEGTAVSELP